MTVAGTATLFDVGNPGGVTSVVTGPDGNIWFTKSFVQSASMTAMCTVGRIVVRAVVASAEVNAPTFAVGSTLITSARIDNPGVAESADFYLGVVVPDGLTMVFWTGDGATALGRTDDLTSFQPYAAGETLASAFSRDLPGFFSYRWTGTEPHGDYVFFNLVTKAGALADRLATPDEILGLATTRFSFP
jgi:hypothetical protein